MLHGLVRVMTGLELALGALTAFIGASFFALVSVGTEGMVRTPVLISIAVATVALLLWNALTVLRRLGRLHSGLCGHPDCHGTLEADADIPEHLLICDHCRRVWPRLTEPEPQPATA